MMDFSLVFAIIFLCLTVRSSSISIADRSNEEMSTERPMTTIETNDDSRDELENQSSFPNDEVIELNIGGQKMSTFRSTLTFLESSKLAQLFQNKQSEAKLFKDKDGAFFFDYNPIHFNYLLDQLRALKQKGKMPRQQILFQSPYISSPMNFSLMLKDLGLLPNDFLFPVEGAHTNLSIKSLAGWKECYRSSYDKPFNLSVLHNSCNGTQLLIGCRSTETPETLTLAGIGQFDDVFHPCLPRQCGPNRKTKKKLRQFNCTSSFQCMTQAKRGVGWYNANNQTLGFVRGSLSFTVGPCDSSRLDADYRLCWTNQPNLNSNHTDRCGRHMNLHQSSNWERLIYSLV